MKIKKLTALLLSGLMLLCLCACGKTVPLHTLYASPWEEGATAQLVDIEIAADELNVNDYGVADIPLIRDLTQAFMKINAGKKVDSVSFTPQYTVTFTFDNEEKEVKLSENIAEVATENGKEYYNISQAGEFISILEKEETEKQKADFNMTTLIDSEKVNVSVSNEGSFTSDGDYQTGITVINSRTSTIAVSLTDCTSDGKKITGPETLYIPGKTEIGFIVTFETGEIEKPQSLTFKARAALEADEENGFIAESSEYTILFTGNMNLS